jgi:putative intracellular protease/amidase
MLCSGLVTPAAAAAAADEPPKVLLVVSSEGRLDAAGKHQRPGFEMDELAQAWLVLRANGLRVEVASPTGGAPVADRYDNADDSIRAFKADPLAVAALQATRRTQDVSRGEHAAILVIGGKGAMFDLPSDGSLATLLGAHHASGGVLAAACHGPAVFASVRRPGGQPLVAGRRQAIAVMELAAPHFAHPQFRVSLARAHAGQGDSVRARALIAQVMAPGHEDDKARSEAGKLLSTLPPG